MTARNSILLILKQNPGIEFNALLAKIASNYGNINSARAALSRAIKDLNARGLVKKKQKKIFPTDKGLALLGNEMKTKLILRLNSLVKHRNSDENIDSIVQLLSTLIERSKADVDLLKAARGNTSFFVSDLEKLKKALSNKANHLNYLTNVLAQQIEVLRKLNFSDNISFSWNQKTKNFVNLAIERTAGTDIIVECLNSDFLEKAKQKFFNQKVQEKSILLNKNQVIELMDLSEESVSLASNPINIYAGSIKVQLNHPNIFFIGPVQELLEIEQENK